MAWFTREDFFSILLKKAQSGVEIKLAISNDSINQNVKIKHGKLNDFANCKTYYIGDGNKELMHHKFCIIDNQIVITGSFNWSIKAEKNNHENITISHDQILAKAFYYQFFKLINEPIPREEKILPIAQIIKRLEILKNYVILEDLEDINRENQKLQQFESEKHIADIYYAIKKLQFSQAIQLIDEFIKKYHNIVIFQDVDLIALKLEIHLLEHEINLFDNEKTELEKLLADFNYQHSIHLGDLISEILSLRKKIAFQNNDKSAFEEAQEDEKTYQEQLKEQKSKIYYELNDEEKKKLKQLYRKASQICHPDRVNESQKEIAQKIFIELNQSYEENDLKKVEQILADLQKGIFKSRSENITQLDKLRIIKNQLSQKLTTLQNSIENIKESESYQLIIEIDNWDLYFNEQKNLLERERDKLKALIKDEFKNK